MLLRNQLDSGTIDVPECGVRGKRGDFDPLISDELFYRAQAVPSGRAIVTPLSRARIRTSRCAASYPARHANAGSPAAGRRAGASTTPTITAVLAAAP